MEERKKLQVNGHATIPKPCDHTIQQYRKRLHLVEKASTPKTEARKKEAGNAPGAIINAAVSGELMENKDPRNAWFMDGVAQMINQWSSNAGPDTVLVHEDSVPTMQQNHLQPSSAVPAPEDQGERRVRNNLIVSNLDGQAVAVSVIEHSVRLRLG